MLEGSLKDFSIEDLLQMISLGGKSGELELAGDTPIGKKTGRIIFENGSAKHAETDDAEGEIAAIELLNMKEGKFKFIPKDVSNAKRTINMPLQDIMLQAASKLDEWNKVKSKISSVDTKFVMASEDISSELHLNPLHWKVLMMVGRGKTIKEVATELNMTVFDVAKITDELVSLKVIKESGTAPTQETKTQPEKTQKGFLSRFGRKDE